MELLIIFIVLFTPAVVGFLSGMTGSAPTVIRSETMNSRMVNMNHQNTSNNIFESEHETHGWKPTPLSQAAQVSVTPDGQMEQTLPVVPEVSSLPPEVEEQMAVLIGELGFPIIEVAAPVTISEETSVFAEGSYHVVADPELLEDEFDIDRMLETLQDSDIPPPTPDNLVVFPGQNSPLTAREYNAIRRVYGSDYANQITTTPSLGATDCEIDVMMGRVSFSTDGTILLTYNNTSIPIRGVGITPDLEGDVVLVKGFFIDNEAFMVDETIRNSAARQEVQ